MIAAAWSNPELIVLIANQHCGAAVVKNLLAAKGFTRTDKAIREKRCDIMRRTGGPVSLAAQAVTIADLLTKQSWRLDADREPSPKTRPSRSTGMMGGQGWPVVPASFADQDRKFLTALLEAGRREGVLAA